MVLQSEQLKEYIITIVLDQFLTNSALYEHIILGNINKLYTSNGKFDNQQHYKDIIEAAMESTSEGITYNIPISISTSRPIKIVMQKIALSIFSSIGFQKEN